MNLDFKKIDEYKAIIDNARPFDETMLKQLQNYYRIGVTWSSNFIEGNTLTLNETKVLLEDGITIGGKPLKDTLEAVGHAAAYNYMFTLLDSGNITAQDVQELHRLFYQGIDEENAGKWRSISIVVSGSDYVFPAPGEIQKEIDTLFSWIATHREKLHPVEFAALLHLKFVTIHPYINGNGRTARLLTNLALLQKRYLPVIVPPILKLEYNTAIKHYQYTGDAQEFIEFVATQEVESQKEIIRLFHINDA